MGRIHRRTTQVAAVVAGAGLLLAIAACNEHDVRFDRATGAVERVVPEELGGGEEIDILWMIDNSGSMCRSQEILRNRIDEFADILTDVNIDFHIGITTTHMFDCDELTPEDEEWNAGCVREPVARAGRLQSTPQPIPGFDPACYHPVYAPDDPGVTQPGEEDPFESRPFPGDPNPAHIDPLVANIEQAIECTENPADWDHLTDFDEDELRCSFGTEPLAEECPEEYPAQEDFFPPQEAYRDIPVVLRSQDYTDEDDVFDLEGFRDDFSCAGLVGTRGYGFERGLDAVVTAMSPELTGGPEATIEDQDQYPNAGFIRPTAQTGIIFISDENDCSHDGELDEQTICAVHQCTIEENKGEDGHLTSIEDLYSDFILNLAGTRGWDLDFDSTENFAALDDIDHLDDLDDEEDAELVRSFNALSATVLPASIHGLYQKVDPADTPSQCPEGDPWRVETSCRTEMGRAWSGHRYEYFLRNFPVFFPSPDPNDPERPLSGLVCDDFSDAIDEIAEFFQAEATGCIDDILPCDDRCPPDPYAPQNEQGEQGEEEEDDRCATYPGYADTEDAPSYCRTAIEVRLVPPEDEQDPVTALEHLQTVSEGLEGEPYCISDPADNPPEFSGTCVVHPERYEWGPCEGRSQAISLSWTESQWQQALGGYSIITRYVSSIDFEGDDGEDDETDGENDGENQTNQTEE